MEDLSLHILDIVENSIDAGAGEIEIEIREDLKSDLLEIEIADNGKGIDNETLERVLDPFYTTKTVRRVGLGLSLFKVAARAANGDLTIQSQLNKGTRVRATFQHSHIDRKPLGDMGKTMICLVIGNPGIRIKYRHRKNGKEYILDTESLKTRDEASPTNVVELSKLIQESLRELGEVSLPPLTWK